MIEVEIKGKRELCFLVKRGEVNDIVIPLKDIIAVDYKRLADMENEGGELMKTMRETTLDNGKNALVQYQHLLVTVQKEQPKPVQVEKPAEPVSEAKVEVEDKEPPKAEVKRGRGRPSQK